MKLMNHVYQVGGISLSHSYDASVYLIEGEEELFLIDCGTPEGFNDIVGNIKKLGFSPLKIKMILGTHGHYDHVGAASLWKKHFDVPLFLHEKDRKQVETGDPVKTTAQLLYGVEFNPVKVAGLLQEGQVFSLGNQMSLEVLHTPGHTEGHISFVLDNAGFIFLIAGDAMWGGFNILAGSDEESWRKTMDKLTKRHFDGYTFGHVGANVIADADARIEEAKRQFGTYFNPWFKPMKDTFKYS